MDLKSNFGICAHGSKEAHLLLGFGIFFVGSKGYPVLRYNIEEAAIFQNIWVDHVSVNKLVYYWLVKSLHSMI